MPKVIVDNKANIKIIKVLEGFKGDKGEKGDKGDKGDTGASGQGAWGTITGDIEQQQDLKYKLDLLGGAISESEERLQNQINNKVDKNENIYLSDAYRDSSGNCWRLYSDGQIEQRGMTEAVGYDTSVTINLFVPMADTNYSIFLTNYNANTTDAMNLKVISRSENNFTIWIRRIESKSGGLRYIGWQVKGQKKEV